MCLLTEKIDRQALDAAGPNLRIVANVAVGFDNIDVPVCTERNVAVTNTPGVLDETTADFVWTLLMAVARRLVEADRFARSGAWKKWNLDQLCGTDVWGKTLGIIGLGRRLDDLWRCAAGFAMKNYLQQRHACDAGNRKGIERRVPVTRRGLSAGRFCVAARSTQQRYSRSGWPRGTCEDEALGVSDQYFARARGAGSGTSIDALERGMIAGAALDVLEHEPLIPDGLRRDNVVLAPHLGSASIETRTRMALIAAENAIALFSGQRPPTILNPEALRQIL